MTVHCPVPVQSPDQPLKVEFAPGVASSVTLVPSTKVAEHVEPQSISLPELFTVPELGPAFVTVTEWTVMNVAVMLCAASAVTVHVPVPVQSPDQPVKTEPSSSSAVSVTLVPSS